MTDFNSPLIGNWTYRSFLNNPDGSVPFNDLEFGEGTITVVPSEMDEFTGTIGGPGWRLTLYGSASYGNPFTVRFQGKGVVSGEEWIYDYIGYLVPVWPNGVDQVPALVGSVIRTIPHSSNGGTAPAGVVASFIAVKQPLDS
jgi:hypothetical protein